MRAASRGTVEIVIAGAAVEIRLLGPVEAWRDGEPLDLGGAKPRAVLAVLASRLGTSVTVDELVDALWPEGPPGHPQAAIQTYVSSLRKLLGRDAIATAGGGYRLDVDADAIDSRRFERLLDDGAAALAEERPQDALRALQEALRLWRGTPLSEFAYEDWAQLEVARLTERRLGGREDLLQARLDLGQNEDVVPELEQLVAEQPLREGPRAQLMLALYRSGRQADALAAYQEARALLVEELGIEPGRKLQELQRMILAHDEDLSAAAGPAPPRSNLPFSPTALVGRKKELADLLRLLRGDARLITLTGPGGVGKTRLALEVAQEEAARFPDGAWFVSLAAVRDPRLVLPTTAAVIGVRGPLEEELRDRRILLVLDNLEQVLEAAAEIAALRAACPHLTLVVTSRERLQIGGELEYPLKPLAEAPAVELFRQRAASVVSEFEGEYAEVAAVCAQIDRLPLAIELAAARVKLLSPAALLERLDERLPLLTSRRRDVDDRQRTLRGTIEWSYDLLHDEEKQLFARLSVFRGSFALESAEGVCEASPETLASLLDKSLLRHVDDGRFLMLETIREYAAERLERGGEAEDFHDRHAASFVARAEAAGRLFQTPDFSAALGSIARDHENIRAALEWTAANRQFENAVRIGLAVGQFWVNGGLRADAQRWRDVVLPNLDSVESSLRAAAVRAAAAQVLMLESDFDKAIALAEEALSMAAALDARHVVELYTVLGNAHYARGDARAALEYREQSLTLAREAADREAEKTALHHLGETLRDLGELERAEISLRGAVELAREIGDTWLSGHSLHSLGDLELDRGNFDAAQAWYADALATVGASEDHRGQLYCLAGIAASLRGRGRTDEAARLWGVVATTEEAEGWTMLAVERRRYERHLQGLEQAAAWTEGRSLTLAAAVAFARSLD